MNNPTELPEAQNPVWHDEKHLISEIGGLFQIYERIAGTDNWKRQPKGGYVWYKTLEAALEALPTNNGIELADRHDAKL